MKSMKILTVKVYLNIPSQVPQLNENYFINMKCVSIYKELDFVYRDIQIEAQMPFQNWGLYTYA